MNLEMITIPRFLFCAADVYMLYRFFHALFVRRYEKHKLVLWYLLIVTLEMFINSFGNTILNLLTLPLLCFVFSLVEFRISVKIALLYTTIFYAIFAGGEVAYIVLNRFFSESTGISIVPWFLDEGMIFFIPCYLFRFIFLLLIEHFIKKLELEKNQSFSWYLLIVPVVTIFVMSCFYYMQFPDTILLQGLMCAASLLTYFSNVVIFIILAKYTAVMNQIKYEELYRVKQTMEDSNFQNIIKLNETYRHYMHDIHAYLGNLRMLALKDESQKIVHVIDEMEGTIQEEVDNSFYCGNKVLNAILAERKTRANNKGIQMTIFVENFLNVDFISDADMISMFGNLLDNAIEAAEQCIEGRRTIDVKLFMGTRYILVLYIENSFITPALYRNGRFLTTKKDSGLHGLGIGIVKKLAEKYGGTLSLEERNNSFITTLSVSAASQPDTNLKETSI